MLEPPEQKARREIDAKLTASGWVVQDRDDLDLTAGRGIAVREFPMKAGFGFADYLLYLDRRSLGAVEAKAEGTLTGVEANLTSTRALRQSIVRHAFTGPLVPQDPENEPAAELLKRIATEREERARSLEAATFAKKPPAAKRRS